MLRTAVSSVVRLRPCRLLSTSEGNGGSDGKPKGPSQKDILGEELISAIDGVAGDLHPGNSEQKKVVKNSLIDRLIAHEKATFDSASASATSEMFDDAALANLLSDVASNDKKEIRVPRAIQKRQERRGLVLLRKEIFYQAVQSGYTSTEARTMSERLVEEAQGRIQEQKKAIVEGQREASASEEEAAGERDVREAKLFDLAMQMLEKIYQDDLTGGPTRSVVNVDPNAPKLFGTARLGIWKAVADAEDHSLGFWSQWDRRAALMANQSFGPENSFEEQIQWTEDGKQWPYPIDNEYKLGKEAEVSFVDHVFLERHLAGLGLPKKGPIAHFMHLVCVGLSKNPYMSAEKKMDHLRGFAEYFNEEKQKSIEKLHEQEQIAAQNA